LFSLHNLSESRFFEVQEKSVIPAIEAVVKEELEEWVKSHKARTFEVLTDARHAAVVNSDHNTTTVILHDIDELVLPNQTKCHHLFTFDVPRSEAWNGMAVSTDKIGLIKAFDWLLSQEIRISAVSFDDCSNNVKILTPYQKKFQEFSDILFQFFKDSWHKGKKLKIKMGLVLDFVWLSFAKDPVAATHRFQTLMQKLFGPDQRFEVSANVLASLASLTKARQDLEAAVKAHRIAIGDVAVEAAAAATQANPSPAMVDDGDQRVPLPQDVTEERTIILLTKERVMRESKKVFQLPVLKKILSYLGLQTSGTKSQLIERIFAADSSVHVLERLLLRTTDDTSLKTSSISSSNTSSICPQSELQMRETRCGNVVQTCKKKLEEALKTHKGILVKEKKLVKNELDDKGPLLSSHFHFCATSCNGGTPEHLQTLLLNSLKHWKGDHQYCVSEHCKEQQTPTKVPLTHVVSFITLYFVFTSHKPGTKMALSDLKYYTKDIPTSICESFHSYLLSWVPKGVDFSMCYKARILLAQLCWNSNQDRQRKELPRRKEPDKGKRKRGSRRTLWETPVNLIWFAKIKKMMKKRAGVRI
jgi:hypothetical protein